MAEVILTHADCQDVLCPCQGKLHSDGGQSVLRIGRQRVLLENEVKRITPDCITPDDTSKGLRKCRTAKQSAGRQTTLSVQGNRPVTERLAGSTDGTKSAPGTFSFKGRSSSVLRIGAERGANGVSEAHGQTLAAGVYHCERLSEGGREHSDDFLLLVPESPAALPTAYRGAPGDLGRGARGFVLGVECRWRDHDPAEWTGGKKAYLEMRPDRASDLDAVKDWVKTGASEHLSVQPVAPGQGQTAEAFLHAVLAAADAFEANSKDAAAEYPFLGGVLMPLCFACDFHARAWVRGILRTAREAAAPRPPADLQATMLTGTGSIPAYYFRDHAARKQRCEQRRHTLASLRASTARERLLAVLECSAREVARDGEIRHPCEVVLDDLGSVLAGGRPWTVASRALDNHLVNALWRVTLPRTAGREAAWSTAVATGLLQGYYGRSLSTLLVDRLLVFAQGPAPVAFLAGVCLGGWLHSHPGRLPELPTLLAEALPPGIS